MYNPSIYQRKLTTGDESDWDLGIIAFVLLHPQLNLLQRCRSKKNRTEPLRPSEEISNIKEIRNSFFAHVSSMSCPSATFNTLMTELKRSSLNLFDTNAVTEIDAAEKSPIETNLADQLRQQLREEMRRSREFEEWAEEVKKELLGKVLELTTFANSI